MRTMGQLIREALHMVGDPEAEPDDFRLIANAIEKRAREIGRDLRRIADARPVKRRRRR